MTCFLRPGILALALSAATPALAYTEVEVTPCPSSQTDDCLTAFTVKSFTGSATRPVVVGDTLVLVGIIDTTTGADQLVALEIDLNEPGPIREPTVLDATETERKGYVEVAPDGRYYALFTADERDDKNRNRRVGAIQFFNELGYRAGRLQAPYMALWPEEGVIEWSPVDIFGRYAGTNALTFAGRDMSLRFGRFVLTADVRNGMLTLTELSPAGEGDALEDYLNTMFDPVGFENEWFAPGLTATYNEIADGSASKLRMTVRTPTNPPDTFGDFRTDQQVTLEPNDDRDYRRAYRAITVSPDGRLLAVIRFQDESCDDTLRAYEVRVYDTGTKELVWSEPGTRAAWAKLDLAWARDGRLVLTETLGGLPAHCGLDLSVSISPVVNVRVYKPRMAP
jgi:hypothetical protein